MICKHPSPMILDQFVHGDLDDPIAVIVSAHVESCGQCKKEMVEKEKEAGSLLLKEKGEKSIKAPDFSSMEASILALKEEGQPLTHLRMIDNTLTIKNKTLELPPALIPIKRSLSSWKSFGSISHAKVNLSGKGNLYFVHFEPGSKIAEHSHDGNEYAYVVAGSFRDQYSEYITGDYASFTHDDSHHPYTEDPDGCLLLVSIDGPFYFKEGWARLLNPFRKMFFKRL